MTKLNEQMEMFEIEKDEALKKLDKGVSDLRKERKPTFDNMTKMLESGEVENLSDKDKRNFVELYKLLKQHHFNKKNIKEGGNKKFQEGGLEQDGGTQDPVSGNEVPAGSSQAEVRDDIPAMLSEGEFVFPADVVRYWGLDTLMRMRQEAKAGLQKMEDMGQMGNSSEAIIPDDVPFTVDDLEVEDEAKEMFVGGLLPPLTNMPVTPNSLLMPVNAPQQQQSSLTGFRPQQAQGITFTQQPQTNVGIGTYKAPQFTGKQTTQPAQTFGNLIPSVGGKQETKEYTNEAGQSLFIPFVNDKPVYPIPEGYKLKDLTKTKVEEAKTQDVKTKTTSVRDDDSDSDVLRDEINKSVSKQKGTFGISSPKGLEFLTALAPGMGFLKSIGDIIGVKATGEGLLGKLTAPTEQPKTFDELINELPETEALELREKKARYENILDTRMSGLVGNKVGDLDPATGGIFDKQGRAINEDGSASTNEFGTRSYATLADFKKDREAGRKSGWTGGAINKSTYDKLSDAGKANYDKYSELTGSIGHTTKAVQQRQKITFAPPEQQMKRSPFLTDTDFVDTDEGPEDQAFQADARESMTDRGGFEGEIGDYKGAFVGRKYKKNKGMKRGGLASKK